MSEWYCEIAGREIGPLSAHQLKRMAADGQILAADRVRRGATGDWVAASDVHGLFYPQQEPPPDAAPPDSIFDASEPNVTWPTEATAPPSAALHNPKPEPPPLPPPLPDATVDDSAPLDFLDEPFHQTASQQSSLVLTARARRKRQQQRLVVGSLIFLVLGVVVAIFFLIVGNLAGFGDVKGDIQPASGPSRLSDKQNTATDDTSEEAQIHKDKEQPDSVAPEKTKTPERHESRSAQKRPPKS